MFILLLLLVIVSNDAFGEQLRSLGVIASGDRFSLESKLLKV